MQVADFVRRKQLTEQQRAALPRNIDDLRQRLRQLAETDMAQLCKEYVLQLIDVADTCAVSPGRTGLSRKLLRTLIMHFCTHQLPGLHQTQQEFIRRHAGTRLSTDATFRSAKSISAPDAEAKTVHGKAKSCPFKALVITITAAHGLIVTAGTAPSEAHEYTSALLLGLGAAAADEEAEDASPYLRILRQHAAVGGPLPCPPRLISTDNGHKDCHLWDNVAYSMIDAALKRGDRVLVPTGAHLRAFAFCFLAASIVVGVMLPRCKSECVSGKLLTVWCI